MQMRALTALSLSSLVFGAGLLAPAAGAAQDGAITSTWTGNSGNGVWADDGNWSNNPPMGGYPDNGNQGFSYDAIVRAAAVTVGQAIELNDLTVDNNAFLAGPGPINPLGRTLFGNGLTGLYGTPGVFLAGGDIDVTGEFRIDDWPVDAEQINVGIGGATGAVSLDRDAHLRISGGLKFLKDGSLRGINASNPLGPAVTLDGGVLEKTGGFGVSSVFVKLTSNAGIIGNSSGREIRFLQPTNADPNDVYYTLNETRFALSGANSSVRFVGGNLALNGTTTVVADDGAYVELAGGDFVNNGVVVSASASDGSMRLGPGANHTFSGGVLDLDPAAEFVMDGGRVGVNGQVHNQGAFLWRSGEITGDGFVNQAMTSGAARAAGSPPNESRVIRSTSFLNDGEFLQNRDIRLLGPDALIDNGVGGTWILQGAGLTGEFDDVQSMVNAGTLISRGDSSLYLVKFETSGLIRVESGKLSVSGWRFDYAPGAAVELVGAEMNAGGLSDFGAFVNGELTVTALAPNSQLTGSLKGTNASSRLRTTVAAASGECIVDDRRYYEELELDAHPSFPVVVQGGKLVSCVNTGTFVWRSGDIIVFVNQADVMHNARTGDGQGGTREASGFRNAGYFSQQHDVKVSEFSATVNRMEGTWKIGDADLLGANAIYGFQNAGLFLKDGAEVTSVSCRFENTGTVEAVRGEVWLVIPLQFDHETGELTGGTWIARGSGIINIEQNGIPLACIGANASVTVRDQGVFTALERTADPMCVVGQLNVGNGAQVEVNAGLVNDGEFGEGEITLDSGPTALVHVQRFTNNPAATADIFGGATLQADLGVDLLGGELRGDGGFIVTPLLDNVAGRIGPGTPPDPSGQPVDTTGVMNLMGDYRQGPNGVLAIEIAGIESGAVYDRLMIEGQAALDGTLELSLVDGFTPEIGQTFAFISANALTGQFTQVLPPPGVEFEIDYGPASVTARVTSVTLCDPCDANCDGAVDAFDVEPFIDVLLGGTGCSPCAGDANADGAIDAFDIEPFIACLVGP